MGPQNGKAPIEPEVEKTTDYYFQYYASLQNQANMIQDFSRTQAYRRAILGNAVPAFENKIVIDIGAGSGILSYFAAKAGARKVLAIEASGMASKIEVLLRDAVIRGSNPHLVGRVEVINGKVEDEKIQAEALTYGKVDTIISEPIGVMLYHERMVESYLLARDLFLKPGGTLYPSAGSLYFAPFSDEALFLETEAKASFFNQTLFGTDFTPLAELSKKEAFEQPIVGLINPATLVASEICPQTFDFYTLTNESLQDFTLDLDWYMQKTCLIHGIASWFDLNFAPPRDTEASSDPVNDNLHRQWDETAYPNGVWAYESTLNPAELPPPPADGLAVTLDTGPFAKPTHWQQCRLLLSEPLAVNRGQRVVGSIRFRTNDNRSYDLDLEVRVVAQGPEPGVEMELPGTKRTGRFDLGKQTYNYSYTPDAAMGAMSGLLNGM
ncbi:hypothetical protein NliqN6_5244 [Naganishia liquefaciens]|uniref:type I protein arginine methyltransferase n=1 Tax=Naganishia liquefaciens TaxID=104408 RepID=A0A8H3YI47_9TREE|nr:hypothetical protein NliqN6_5244 [Naganishia liquefaciens]